SGQRRCAAVQGQIAEPDTRQETEPLADLLHDLAADRLFSRGELEVGKDLLRVGDTEARVVRNAFSLELDGEGFRPQAGTLAPQAGIEGKIFREFFLLRFRSLFEAALEVRDHAFPGAREVV